MQVKVASPTDQVPPQGRKRSRRQILVFVLPSLFTTANIFSGFFSIISSIRGEWTNAAVAIFLCGFFDILDGRVARITHSQSAFGEQYDSMADLVSFGMAPSLLMYEWALSPYERLGWLAAFMYLACAALRLARFNVLKQSTEKRYFQGLASPIAAAAVASAVLYYQVMGFEAWKSVYMLIVMFVLASSMVSNIRYRSFKDLAFRSQKGFGYLILILMALLLISAAPEKVLFPIFLVYIIGGALAEVTRFARRRFRWIPGTGRS